eukprot:TRINITY_DN3593_c0_g2_i1.p1 TRINITY_DN3593_c0_g2~~TRINITY_DN3593_c0_g2_i1.p1  ORF type:complete len:235 (-),score=65.69 TRINITY_DN3593_c0_g2_i1:33-737(-)
MDGSGRYGFSLTTFSPKGKLVQIEYALNAISDAPTSVGIKALDGIVLATEKKLSPLSDSNSVKKIVALTDNIGLTYAGMGPDFRVLVRKGRKKAQEYYRFYGENIPVLVMVRELANIMQEYTQSGGVRPFGVSLLVAGVDAKGPQVYQVDPSGSYFAWIAYAIGSGMIQAENFLSKRRDDIAIEDAIHRAIRILREGFQHGEIQPENLEIGIVRLETGTFESFSTEKIRDYLED